MASIIGVFAVCAVILIAGAPILIWGEKDPSQSDTQHKHR